MHFEFLVEDQSGKTALDLLVPKIIGEQNSFRIHSYKGCGRIPKNLNHESDPQKRILLERLPSLLKGYGKSYPPEYPAAVIVVCDLDRRCLKEFRKELVEILENCNPEPTTRFCIAVEEDEAWLLGDPEAIKKAYPKAKTNILRAYENDSVCGTWERLADAIYPGGSQKLSSWQQIGKEKSEWARNISPYMQIRKNASPSFRYFLKKLDELKD
jgi:hypothetical protein